MIINVKIYTELNKHCQNLSFMVVRVLSYVSLLYLDVVKPDVEVQRSKKLPPVLPLILYNGQKPWHSSVSFECFLPSQLPKTLRRYQPSFTCWLLDVGQYTMSEEVMSQGNLVSSLVALEQSQEVSDTLFSVNRLVELLKGQKFDSLRRAFMVYLNRILRINEVLPINGTDEYH